MAAPEPLLTTKEYERQDPLTKEGASMGRKSKRKRMKPKPPPYAENSGEDLSNRVQPMPVQGKGGAEEPSEWRLPTQAIEAPPEQGTQASSNEERVYGYLTEHGAAGPLRISKTLGLEWSEVIKALKNLQKDGKVHLR